MHLLRYTIAAAISCISLHATVTITSITPSVSSPQPVGTPVSFSVTTTDTNPGPLTFQFSAADASGIFSVVRNFNIGTNNAGVWSNQPFSWSTIEGEGSYTIQVTAEDFATGETASQTIPFTLTSLISAPGIIAVVPTSHPLVALTAVPPCPLGSSARVYFTRSGVSHPAGVTPFQPCGGTISSNFYIGGLQVNTSYTMGYQVQTGQKIKNFTSQGTFQSGKLPNTVTFPVQTVLMPPAAQSYTNDKVLLHGYLNTAAPGQIYQPTATDLAGHITWFYNSTDLQVLLTRPLPGANFLLLQSGVSWDTNTVLSAQTLRQVDLTSNVVKETNVGLVQQQFLALGATDLQPCRNISLPAAVGSSCLSSFSHDFISLSNGNFAFIGIMEKIFPPGTQGDTTGLNVDILGEAVMVVDSNLNALWYFDTFQHDGGGNQLDINRPAVLGETCTQLQGGCPPLLLAGTAGVTNLANDWLHCNSLQYRPSDGNFVLSSRSQDWVMLIDYNNGAGTSNILWRMGPDGDFTFNNINNDPYPWFSHQHDAGFETNGVFTVFDNGNTRIVQEGGGNSRGMALTVDETAFMVTPVLTQDLGYYSFALGSAQLLPNGNYHFQPGFIQPGGLNYSIELFPTAGTTGASPVFNLEGGSTSYRSFRMPDMYTPPST